MLLVLASPLTVASGTFQMAGGNIAYPSIWCVIEWCQKEEATVRTIIQQDAVGYPPVKRTQQRHVQPSYAAKNTIFFLKKTQNYHYRNYCPG
jgi:hypothetical protein